MQADINYKGYMAQYRDLEVYTSGFALHGIPYIAIIQGDYEVRNTVIKSR